jgi:hypothetical protein
MVRIIGQVTTDEHGGISTMISPTQEQRAEIGSDKLPSVPWDLGVHFVSMMFYVMLNQVAPESHTIHLGLIWSGLAGTTSIEMFLQMQPHSGISMGS